MTYDIVSLVGGGEENQTVWYFAPLRRGFFEKQA